MWYCGAMIRETKAFDCTCEKCGCVWFSPTIPPRCSKCKSRKWNEGAKPEKMIIEKPKPVEIPKPIEREVEKPAKVGRLAPCPRCEGPTVNWGPMRRCQKCGQNWPLD